MPRCAMRVCICHHMQSASVYTRDPIQPVEQCAHPAYSIFPFIPCSRTPLCWIANRPIHVGASTTQNICIHEFCPQGPLLGRQTYTGRVEVENRTPEGGGGRASLSFSVALKSGMEWPAVDRKIFFSVACSGPQFVFFQ